MFAFLTRLGRLFVATIVLGGVISILGVMSVTGVLVASHHNASSAMSCAVTTSGVGQPLTLSGHGYAPNTQYLVFTTSPGGNGETTANSDATGAINASLGTAYWHGTYGASIYTEGGSSSKVATCSSVTV